MVRQSGPDEGDDQQGRKFCDAYVQSSTTVAGVAGRRCWSQNAACSRGAGSKSRRPSEPTYTEIARQCATGIATVDSFARLDAAAYAGHDSTKPKDHEGSERGSRWTFEAVVCNRRLRGPRPLPHRIRPGPAKSFCRRRLRFYPPPKSSSAVSV